jgi:hypothetical protein
MKNQPSPRLRSGRRPSAALSSAFVNDEPCRFAFFLRVSSALHLDIFAQPEHLSFSTACWAITDSNLPTPFSPPCAGFVFLMFQDPFDPLL